MRVDLGEWSTMRRWAEPIRFAVFVVEQKVPVELELDEWDERSVHAVAFDATGTAVATGRLLPDGHIGRMAVSESVRGKGLGSAVLEALMDEACRRGYPNAVLSAQTHAAGFYERHGFQRQGSIYLDAGIEHVDMRRPLR